MKQLYVSNDGAGPYLARIESVEGRVVKMVRWHKNNPRRLTRFELPKKFLASPSCGWRATRESEHG